MMQNVGCYFSATVHWYLVRIYARNLLSEFPMMIRARDSPLRGKTDKATIDFALVWFNERVVTTRYSRRLTPRDTPVFRVFNLAPFHRKNTRNLLSTLPTIFRARNSPLASRNTERFYEPEVHGRHSYHNWLNIATVLKTSNVEVSIHDKRTNQNASFTRWNLCYAND